MPRPDRPTTDPRRPVVDTFDFVWGDFMARLDGITAEELAWQPVANTWAVRVGPDGSVRADEHDFEAAPGPVPTINWRLWHIAVDCLDDYSQRTFRTTFASVSGLHWHLDPEPARADLEAAYRGFRDACLQRSVEEWWAELGPNFGPWHAHNLFDFVQHALHEITHHAAEVALLRDLYRERFS
jgi:hypothetical protein